MIRNTLIAASLVGSSMAAQLADWQQRSIYQLVTDRFAKTTNDGGACDSGARQYCGGTWQGVINQLDYIQGMGFDAVWISPAMANIEGNTTYGAAYHGYWPVNYNALNSHFGTEDDLKALSAALHKRGMYLMMDIIVNHVAATTTPPSLTYDQFQPFNAAADFHPFCFIQDYQNQTQVEQCWVGDANLALADINTEDSNIVSTYNTWIKNLVTTYNVDGLRLDTVKHVRQDFWPDFLSSAGVFAVGEVLDDRYNYTGAYTKVMDTVFNYPEWFNLIKAFLNPQADMGLLSTSVDLTKQNFKNGALSTVSFSENHDNARNPSGIFDPMLIKSIMTWTFGGDGIPTLYYGQEAGYSGGNDPMNREALWFTSYSTDVMYYKFITKLNQARKMALADKTAKFASTPAEVASSTSHHIALSKYPMLTVLTNSGNASANVQWSITNSGFKSGVTLVDVLSDACESVQVASDGSVPVTFKAGAPKVYLPTTSLNSTSVCGTKAQASSGSSSSAQDSAAFHSQAVTSSVILSVLASAFAFFALA